MGQHNLIVVKLYPEHCSREDGYDFTFNWDSRFGGHGRTRANEIPRSTLASIKQGRLPRACDVQREPAILLRRFDDPGTAAVFGDILRFTKGLRFFNLARCARNES